ncbi:helix-turn-helix transcriptional regulator [Tenacibaculum ovolyticum]|uniref:helix-turn-helix transcriptional regulator n=1 Tax=Tenacibaculum ovolyticum TaxID=104270 RepID=UPI0007ECEF23|nr:helix-turn-helix transcriptional regulator [Tenacibaculum ovolyticum]
MTTNKEKFQSLISKDKSNTISRNRDRIKNRSRLRESQHIALKILNKLNDLGWSQRKLAEKLDVTPQQVNKIVKGKENLTLETQVKLQEVLNIPILASYYENKVQAFSFKDIFNFDIDVPLYTPNVSSGTSFYKEVFKDQFNKKPIIVEVRESNYQIAS